MEIGKTNDVCSISLSIEKSERSVKMVDNPILRRMEKATETNDTHVSSLSVANGTDATKSRADKTLPNTSFVKRLFGWRKYIILVFTPILLMPLPITLPSPVRNL